MTEVEKDAVRGYCNDWLDDGRPATVCHGIECCDPVDRAVLGCCLDARYRGRGTAIGHCPGWLRRTALWESLALLLGSARQVGHRSAKMLQAVRLANIYDAEEIREESRRHGDDKRKTDR